MKTLKSRLAVMLDSVLQWLRLARRARPEEPVSPQQLRTSLAEMLADLQVRRLTQSRTYMTVGKDLVRARLKPCRSRTSAGRALAPGVAGSDHDHSLSG